MPLIAFVLQVVQPVLSAVLTTVVLFFLQKWFDHHDD